MFVYYKLYREPFFLTISTTLCGDQGKKWQSPALRLCTRRQEALILFFFFFYERPLSSLLTNRPLLLQPQQAAHKHETGVANPQYLILYIILKCAHVVFFILNDESMLFN